MVAQDANDKLEVLRRQVAQNCVGVGIVAVVAGKLAGHLHAHVGGVVGQVVHKRP